MRECDYCSQRGIYRAMLRRWLCDDCYAWALAKLRPSRYVKIPQWLR